MYIIWQTYTRKMYPEGKIFVLVFKSTPQCWNQHRSADFSTAARTYSRGGPNGGVDEICASHWRKWYQTKWQSRNCRIQIRLEWSISLGKFEWYQTKWKWSGLPTIYNANSAVILRFSKVFSYEYFCYTGNLRNTAVSIWTPAQKFCSQGS